MTKIIDKLENNIKEMHCMADGHNHEETVDDDFTCDDWN